MRGRFRRRVAWTRREDDLLRAGVEMEEEGKELPSDGDVDSSADGRGKSWARISAHVPGRSGKQCRERWVERLRPGLRKGGWTPSEDRVLRGLYARHGASWTVISGNMQNRSPAAVKNRIHGILGTYRVHKTRRGKKRGRGLPHEERRDKIRAAQRKRRRARAKTGG